MKTQIKLNEDLHKEKENVWQENVQLSNQRDGLTQELDCMNILIEKVVHGKLLDFLDNAGGIRKKILRKIFKQPKKRRVVFRMSWMQAKVLFTSIWKKYMN